MAAASVFFLTWEEMTGVSLFVGSLYLWEIGSGLARTRRMDDVTQALRNQDEDEAALRVLRRANSTRRR